MKPRLVPLLLLMFAVRCLASSVAITTTRVPNGMVGSAYSAAIRAEGGCAPYSWAIVSGTLPKGVTKKVSANKTALDLSGMPTVAASYSFTVAVTGCGKGVSKASYKIVVQAAANHVVDLSWKASTLLDIAGYNMYRAPDGVSWKKINRSLIAATLYNDSTVANGSTYYYAATAVDTHGHESRKTTPVKAVVP